MFDLNSHNNFTKSYPSYIKCPAFMLFRLQYVSPFQHFENLSYNEQSKSSRAFPVRYDTSLLAVQEDKWWEEVHA